MINADFQDRVCIIGSGNWGSAIATIVGRNCRRLSHVQDAVNMWVFEEEISVNGEKRPLSQVINEFHENMKYLPGIPLPDNVVAVPDLAKACRNATLLIFVLPHQVSWQQNLHRTMGIVVILSVHNGKSSADNFPTYWQTVSSSAPSYDTGKHAPNLSRS